MEGLKEYNTSKEKLSAAEEKRFELSSRLAQAERAEQVAAAKFGWDSVEHRDAQYQATKLAGLTHKASVATNNATNQLNADTTNAKNALDAQQNLFTHQYQMGSLDAQRTSAAKLSDYETYLQDAKKDKRNWSMVDGKPIFDIDKVTSGYRGYDNKSQGQFLATLKDQYKNELDPKKKEYIGMQIQAILSGGDPSAVSMIPGITAPRADLFKPVK
jgi:preprotein translocase subunit SecD